MSSEEREQHDSLDSEVRNVATTWSGVDRTLSRRSVLGRGVALGIGGSVASILLAACGGDDDDDDSADPTATEVTDSSAEPTATAAESGGGDAEPTDSGEESEEPTEAADEAPAGETPVGELAGEQVVRLPSTEPIGLDPAVSYGYGLSQFRNLFAGLVGLDPHDGAVITELAESFEANDDATEYTFSLRSGLTWSDGTALNANDFVWSWKRVLEPETASQYIPALYPIKGVQEAVESGGSIDDIGVTASDDQTLVVKLAGSTPFFPLLVTTWTFYPVPRHIVEEHGAGWFEAGNLVTNGPYVLAEWNHNQNIVLEINPEYYGEQPTITRVEYRLFDDEIAQGLIAYENDELDFAEVPSSDVERVKGDSNLSAQLLENPRSQTRFIVCDCTNAPTDDVRVRQALSMAIDRDVLANQVRQGNVAPAPTVLPPDITGYNPDAGLGFDVDKAKALLAEAGYEDPSSIEISMVYISTADYKLDAEYVQSAWTENLGIKVTLEPIEQNTYSDWRASRETSPFNTYIGNWGSDFDDPSNWHNQNFTTSSDHYRNHWEYPEFNELVDQASVNTNEEERAQQYMEAEAMLVEQAPIIPLHHAYGFYVVKPYLKNVFLQPILPVVYAQYAAVESH